MVNCNRDLWDYELLESVKKMENLISDPKEYHMHPGTYMRLRVELPYGGIGILIPDWHAHEQTMFGLPLIQDWSVPEDEIIVLPNEEMKNSPQRRPGERALERIDE